MTDAFLTGHSFAETSDDSNQEELLERHKQPPQKLYKYREVNENNLNSLERNNTWCAAAFTFNDPYDSSMTLRLSVRDKNDLFIKGLLALPKVGLQALDSKIIEHLKEASDPPSEYNRILLERGLIKNIAEGEIISGIASKMLCDSMDNAVQTLTEQLKNDFKISCFCENLSSMPMWYHYADRYRGFVVEYNFIDEDKYDYILSNLWPVIYSERLFNLGPYLKAVLEGKPKDKLLPIYACTSKSIDWEYEKEWRLIIRHKDSENGFIYSMPKPQAVYIGKDISISDRNAVLEVATSKNIKTYEMHLSSSEFKMVPYLIEK